MMFTVDPMDDNNAIDHSTGDLLNAVRVVKIANPEAPTVAELNAASSIIGYGSFTVA